MNQGFETPILFLIFNRPDTSRKVFEVIRQIKPSKLFIAADGPRASRVGEIKKCEETRKIIKEIDWECEVKTLIRDENFGCGKAVSSAITWFFENVEEGIILEDDCLPNLDFFGYCKDMLDYYRENKDVMTISGDNFQSGKKWGNASYYFSAYSYVWGWATWKRAWNLYDFKLEGINNNNIEDILKNYFSDAKQIKYWKNIFKKMKSDNPIDTWDYQLALSIWKNKGVSVAPNVNLITNIGFGDFATHTLNKDAGAANILSEHILPITHADEILICKEADKNYFKSFVCPSFILKVTRRIFKILKTFFS